MHRAWIRGVDPERRALPHEHPPWVDFDAFYLITACTRPRHRNQLCTEPVARDLRRCLQLHDERGEWQLAACVLMPDHLHVLAMIPPCTDIVRMVGRWKRFTARAHGVEWQRDFFERRLRSTEHVDAKREYLRQNPVRAGLVERAEEWPFFWAAW